MNKCQNQSEWLKASGVWGERDTDLEMKRTMQPKLVRSVSRKIITVQVLLKVYASYPYQ